MTKEGNQKKMRFDLEKKNQENGVFEVGCDSENWQSVLRYSTSQLGFSGILATPAKGPGGKNMHSKKESG